MTNNNAQPLVYLIAGELSGDLLGGRLMQALSEKTDAELRFAGVGGDNMTAQGLHSLFPMSELSVMGIAEVLPKIPKLLGRINQVVDDVERCRPDIVISIDAPDFSFRVGKRLKGMGIPLVHYVAPTVWAWRPGRAAKIAKFLDHLLCLFPFEPPYFERVGLSASFVGHSVIESTATQADGPDFRKQHGISPETPVLAVLPGSRFGEVTRHLPVFKETVQKLQGQFADLQLLCVTTGPVARIVRDELASWPVPCHVTEDPAQKYNAMAAADVALAASGTVALELGVVGTPTVIAYQVNWLTAWIGRRLVKARYASLINILLDREIMPERLIENCRPDLLAPEIARLLSNPDAREAQKSAFKQALAKLSGGPEESPSQKAAQIILDLIARTPTAKKNGAL